MSYTIDKSKLTNCSVTVTPEPFNADDSVTVVWKANAGYKFTDANSNGCRVRFNMGYTSSHWGTLQSDGTISVTFTGNAKATEYWVEGNAVVDENYKPETPTTYTIDVSKLSNITCTAPANLTLTVGTETTVTIQASDGYTITGSPRVTYEYGGGIVGGYDMTISDDAKTATVKFTPETNHTNYAIDATATASTTDGLTFTVDKLTNCVCTSPADYKLTPNVENTITLTANDGYIFSATDNTPRFVYKDSLSQQISDKFTISADGLTATITVTPSSEWKDIYINGGAIASTTFHDIYGLITVYLPTAAQLETFAANRYKNDGSGNVYYDTGEYIIILKRMFINIAPYKSINFKLGPYTFSDLTVNIANDNVVITDCGNVDVVGNYNNALDFTDSTIELYLPFVGFRSIDVPKVMNKTVHIEYHTNVLNGETLIMIYANNVLIDTVSCNVGFDVPYLVGGNINVSNALQTSAGYLYGFTPQLIVREKIQIDNGSAHNDDAAKTVKDMNGFIRFKSINVTGISATETEITEIENLMKEGVFYGNK